MLVNSNSTKLIIVIIIIIIIIILAYSCVLAGAKIILVIVWSVLSVM